MKEFMDWINGFQLPEAASNFADKNDPVFFILFMVSLFWFVLITGLTIYFCVRYRYRGGSEIPPRITHHHALEIAWTIIPTIICFYFFWVGAKGYLDMNVAPENATHIEVKARQWKWDFIYPNGATDSILTVPIDEDVQLSMRSTDVLHSFFVPNFRVKMDVLPDRITQVWFRPNKLGSYRLFCTEYCGRDHSRMITDCQVVTREDYEKYLLAIDKPKPGDVLYAQNCVQCHSLEGKTIQGPALNGIWGKTEEMEDGSSVVVDEEYFIESLMQPNKKIVKGYAPGMPPFKGTLKDEEVQNLINFVKSHTPGAQ